MCEGRERRIPSVVEDGKYIFKGFKMGRVENRINQVNMARVMLEAVLPRLDVKVQEELTKMFNWKGEVADRAECDVDNLLDGIKNKTYLSEVVGERLTESLKVMKPKKVLKMTQDDNRRNYVSKIASQIMYQAESYKKWFLIPATPDLLIVGVNSVIETMMKIGQLARGEKGVKPIEWIIKALDYIAFDWKGKPTCDIEKFEEDFPIGESTKGYKPVTDKDRRLIVALMMGLNNPKEYGRSMVVWVDAVAQNLQIMSALMHNKELAVFAGLDPQNMNDAWTYWTTPVKDFNTELQKRFADGFKDAIWEELKDNAIVIAWLETTTGDKKTVLARKVFVREIAKKIFMMWGFGSGASTLLAKAPNYADGVQDLKLTEKAHKALISRLLNKEVMYGAIEKAFAGSGDYRETFDAMALQGTVQSIQDQFRWDSIRVSTDGVVNLSTLGDVHLFEMLWRNGLKDTVMKGREATVTLPDGSKVSKGKTKSHNYVNDVVGDRVTYSTDIEEDSLVEVKYKGTVVGHLLRHRTYLMSQLVHSTDGYIVRYLKNNLKHYYGISILSNHDAYGSHPEFVHILKIAYARGLQSVSRTPMLETFVNDNSNDIKVKKVSDDNYLDVLPKDARMTDYPLLVM